MSAAGKLSAGHVARATSGADKSAHTASVPRPPETVMPWQAWASTSTPFVGRRMRSSGGGALESTGRTPSGHVPFRPDAEKALELALRGAIRLQQRSIRSEHVLLGIVRAESPGRTVVQDAGIDITTFAADARRTGQA